jgi:hypothetical protein
MRSCLEWPAAGLDDGLADRAGDLGFLIFRVAERLAVFALDLLVMGILLRLMRRHPPHHLGPARGKSPAGHVPERLQPPRSPQQRSDQAQKPVHSEQENCSFERGCAFSKVSLHGSSSSILAIEPRRTISSSGVLSILTGELRWSRRN